MIHERLENNQERSSEYDSIETEYSNEDFIPYYHPPHKKQRTKFWLSHFKQKNGIDDFMHYQFYPSHKRDSEGNRLYDYGSTEELTEGEEDTDGVVIETEQNKGDENR